MNDFDWVNFRVLMDSEELRLEADAMHGGQGSPTWIERLIALGHLTAVTIPEQDLRPSANFAVDGISVFFVPEKDIRGEDMQGCNAWTMRVNLSEGCSFTFARVDGNDRVWSENDGDEFQPGTLDMLSRSVWQPRNLTATRCARQ